MTSKMSKAICIIPARLESKRFPRKIFVPIHGKALFHYVYDLAVSTELFQEVRIATHNREVIDQCLKLGIPHIKTEDHHTCGSSRIIDAANQMSGDWDIVVNLQADQPFLPRDFIETVLTSFTTNPIATVAYESNAIGDSNTVKVITNNKNEAVYFSRFPIPYTPPDNTESTYLNHLGLYAFTRDFVETYKGRFDSHLAQRESLEQLDFIFNGFKIDVGLVSHSVPEINVPEDLVSAKNLGLL